MKAAAGSTLVSFAGQTYHVVNGFIELPEEAAHELRSHGYTMANADEAEPRAVKRGRPRKETPDVPEVREVLEMPVEEADE
jgi:hypothetical protein